MIDDLVCQFPENEQARARQILTNSRLRDITEYGRVVHAEMEALLACARSHISCVGATLYCTTFPCHNCAKHIVGAGVEQVVYIEPYPKSKALKFHDDSVTTGKVEAGERKVRFKPFIGVGPRRFLTCSRHRLEMDIHSRGRTTKAELLFPGSRKKQYPENPEDRKSEE